MDYGKKARLALAALNREKTEGIPAGLIHIMQHSVIERLAGDAPGSYANDPHGVYLKMCENVGVCMIDQYIATNPLAMGDNGYERGGGTATTGGLAVCDGILIDSPEAVVTHIEKFAIPELEKYAAKFDAAEFEQAVINNESMIQKLIGPEILKTGYGQLGFPYFDYGAYGYEPYFSAYALYPDVIENLFKAYADYFTPRNAAVVNAYKRAGLPLYHRLDHDMADSRGLLTGVPSLEKIWLPHFERCIRPAADAGFNLLWHCDGNLSELVPLLIECGVNGFQGFQYEDGMDYAKICKMRARNGESLIIEAGVSVTRELPFGKTADVKRQLKFLVENGPETGLFLAFSSSCVPGTPFENIEAAIEGIKYYGIQ